MAKGKQTAMSARRQLEEAHKIIDRQNVAIAEAMLRAKEAEARAARLEGIERLVSSAPAKNDELLVSALTTIKEWKKIAHDDGRRRGEALREVFTKVCADLRLMEQTSSEDKRQFLETRYPRLMDALFAGKASQRDPRMPLAWPGTPFHRSESKLTDDQLRRFQRLTGERTTFASAPDSDAADIWIDVLDAKQVGFSGDEIMEYAGLGGAK